MGGQLQRYLIEALDEVLSLVPEDGEIRDLDRCRKLALGVEGVFRREVKHQYAGWPPEWTTDGSVPDLCIRTGPAALDLVGRMWIGFTGELFPFRAEIGRVADGALYVVGSVGQIDESTGRPPRLRAGTLVLPVRDDDDQNPVPLLVLARRSVPITWTPVLQWP